MKRTFLVVFLTFLLVSIGTAQSWPDVTTLDVGNKIGIDGARQKSEKAKFNNLKNSFRLPNQPSEVQGVADEINRILKDNPPPPDPSSGGVDTQELRVTREKKLILTTRTSGGHFDGSVVVKEGYVEDFGNVTSGQGSDGMATVSLYCSSKGDEPVACVTRTLSLRPGHQKVSNDYSLAFYIRYDSRLRTTLAQKLKDLLTELR